MLKFDMVIKQGQRERKTIFSDPASVFTISSEGGVVLNIPYTQTYALTPQT